MDIFKQGMKGPTRPAPAVPGLTVNRYSPVTNWNDDPFGADVFEPTPQCKEKKKPPPRPPPPKLNKQPDIPAKPTHFMRRPTVLSSLLSRKTKPTVPNPPSVNGNSFTDNTSAVDSHKMFPKCEPKTVQTGALIDFSSPPSSPTFTTRSSSDGLSVDSFGSDATTSTSHHNNVNGGSSSQAESGFEDDFDLFLHSRKIMNKEDTFDDFANVDPFSPLPASNKPPLLKKPVANRDLYDVISNGQSTNLTQLKGPTIIRAKPARPKPPDNSAILKSTFGNGLPVTLMNVNTTTPIQKVNSFGDNFDEPKPFSWEQVEECDRESSPPMPSIPPPPPPPLETLEDIPVAWPDEDMEDQDLAPSAPRFTLPSIQDEDEPYAVALFDYHTGHPDDLSFTANTRIKLIRKENNEWLFGKLRNGSQGLFPSSYVEIKVPLPNELMPSTPHIGTATALYDFEPAQPGDLRFICGDSIKVTHKLNDEWYFGECNGIKGQFPINYVDMKF